MNIWMNLFIGMMFFIVGAMQLQLGHVFAVNYFFGTANMILFVARVRRVYWLFTSEEEMRKVLNPAKKLTVRECGYTVSTL